MTDDDNMKRVLVQPGILPMFTALTALGIVALDVGREPARLIEGPSDADLQRKAAAEAKRQRKAARRAALLKAEAK